MKSFFGSKKGAGEPAERRSESQHRPEPDEHTRLLPNRPHGDDPYLSPDDPAVSPYNLWSIRVIRYFTILLTIITSSWWILVLVSLFITPPGLHSRGPGFFTFSYASVALTLLVATLLFFAAPSKSIRVLAAANAALLLVDTVIIAAVEKTRNEEAWVGIASVVWALLMALWVIVVDRTVQWGKTEEEERLTGRPETRRTLLEWIEVTVSSIVLLILCLVSVLLTCTLILRALDAGLAPPGSRYWVDEHKYQIHLYCTGHNSKEKLPTVLFEGGEDPVEYGLWQFAEGALANGSITRYCFADRPGIAWSDTAPSPFSASQAADALSEALVWAGEVGPWVLASAGIGSIYSRVFSSRHGSDIQGILMIDPLHEDLLYRVGSPGRGFLLWLRGIISPLGLDRIPGALFKGRNKADRVWGPSSYQTGRSIYAKLQESLVADSVTKRDVISSRAIQFQDTPLTVLSSGVQIRGDSEWETKQRDLSRVTHNLLHWDIVDDAPHQIWRTLEGREMMEKRLKKLVRARAAALEGAARLG